MVKSISHLSSIQPIAIQYMHMPSFIGSTAVSRVVHATIHLNAEHATQHASDDSSKILFAGTCF